MTVTEPTHQAAVARLKGYLERDPDNWNLRADLFDALLGSGDWEGARAQLGHALERLPDDAGWLHRQAMLHLAQGQYAEAQGVLESLLARGLDAPAIRHNLGYALFGQGRWEAARDVVAPLLALTEEGAGAALALWLRCQHQLGGLEEGLETLKRFQSERRVSPDAVGVGSLMALDEGLMDEARKLSDGALAEKRDQLEALATRGTLLLAVQDAKGAQEWFGRALRVNPGDGRSWSGLAFARMLGQDLRGALEAFARAAQAMPEHQGTWIGYGWCQLLIQDPVSARATFERAVEIDRTIAEPHGGLAAALARLGDKAGALTEIEVAFRLDRANLSAHYAQAVLSGEADNPEAFRRFATKLLSDRPVGAVLPQVGTLADLVLGRRSPTSRPPPSS